MLVVSDVMKRYGKVTACNQVSFTMEPGSVTVLLVYLGLLPAVVIIIVGLNFDAVVPALAGVALVDILLGMIAFAIAPQFLKNGRR